MTTPEAVPRTFSERDHKDLYVKWLGMVDNKRDHFDPQEVEEDARTMIGAGIAESDEDRVPIPDVPLEVTLSD